MKKIVINSCYGGFGLSYEAVMEYAKLKKIKLYAFVDGRDENGRLDFHKHIPYNPKKSENVFIIHYATKPLVNGKYDNDAYFSVSDIERDDPCLVKTVEKLGAKANGHCAKLKIIEIPDNVDWEIDEYDGMELVQEKCRKWS